jgi:hypothetical protein
MTLKISLFAAAGIAALALNVSAAFAHSSTPNSGASAVGRSVPTQGSIPYTVPGDGFARAVRAKPTYQPNVGSDRDRSALTQGSIPYTVPGDGFALAVRAKPTYQPNVGSDRNERAAAAAGPAYAASASSGSGIEWPQIGLGFGVGIVLALGFVLGLRHVRVRPLAH